MERCVGGGEGSVLGLRGRSGESMGRCRKCGGGEWKSVWGVGKCVWEWTVA